MFVPTFTANSQDVPTVLTKKCASVIERFRQTYPGHSPDFISRSPGRVNVIGEHIDYSDFSVLPLAIDVDMLLAVRVIDGKNPSITLTNVDPRFAQRKFDLPLNGDDISVDPSVSDWSNYFKCGLLVGHNYLKKNWHEKFANRPLVGLEVFCQGDVPVGSGLSSSTAFICAVTLAVIKANLGLDFQLSKRDLIEATIIAEHYVGVNNGGMDQATTVCGEEDNALFVQFKPELEATPFKFPELKTHEVQFVIANTLVVANKYETGPVHYNLRVVEVIVAANVMANKCGVALNYGPDSGFEKGNLRDFLNAYYHVYCPDDNGPWNGNVNEGIKRLAKMLEIVEQTLGTHKEGFSVDETAQALGCSREEFTRTYLTVVPIRFQVLKLYQRAKHVFSEALRVLQALKLMTERSTLNRDEEFFEEFGALMNQSQNSCAELYECSSPEIDNICRIALDNGSYGSRLTGAGWGGATVHLVPGGPNGNVEQVKTALIEQYYKKQYPDITAAELDSAIIVSKPAPGSCIYKL